MRISDWSSDVCSSDLCKSIEQQLGHRHRKRDRLHLPDAGSLRADAEQQRADQQIVGCEIENAQDQESRPADLRRRQRDKALVRQHHKADGGGKPPYRDSDDGGAEHCEKLAGRSEEHTSELQSLMRISYAVFYLKKK